MAQPPFQMSGASAALGGLEPVVLGGARAAMPAVSIPAAPSSFDPGNFSDGHDEYDFELGDGGDDGDVAADPATDAATTM